jgi:hypothetical protein
LAPFLGAVSWRRFLAPFLGAVSWRRFLAPFLGAVSWHRFLAPFLGTVLVYSPHNAIGLSRAVPGVPAKTTTESAGPFLPGRGLMQWRMEDPDRNVFERLG